MSLVWFLYAVTQFIPCLFSLFKKTLAVSLRSKGRTPIYSGTLIIGALLGRGKIGQISKVVILSRCSGHIL